MTQAGPTIALCVIARNEEEMLGECLDSARHFVDEIVVVDTGSTDRTVELARQRGARVTHFTWIDDFAAARNAAIEAATADWILMLDADERLDAPSGPLLRKAARQLPPNTFALCVQIENQSGGGRCFSHYVARFFPRRADLRFVGAIHEELRPKLMKSGAGVINVPSLRVFHLGYEEQLYASRGKDERNLRLLEHELARDPHSARSLYYLIQQHFSRARYPEILPLIERFMANKQQVPRACEVEVFRMWIEGLWTLGRNEELLSVRRAAERAGALCSYAYESLGRYELERGNTRAALEAYLRALDPALPTGVRLRPSGQFWELRVKVADLHWALGEHKRCLKQLEQVFPGLPEDRRCAVAVTAAERCMQAQAGSTALRWAARARECLPDNLRAHLELLDLELSAPAETARAGRFATLDDALSVGNWQTAYDAAVGLAPVDLPAVARLVRLAEKLTDQGAPDAAVDLLERAIDAQSTQPLVYWHLARALIGLGRPEDAAQALTLVETFGGADKLARAA